MAAIPGDEKHRVCGAFYQQAVKRDMLAAYHAKRYDELVVILSSTWLGAEEVDSRARVYLQVVPEDGRASFQDLAILLQVLALVSQRRYKLFDLAKIPSMIRQSERSFGCVRVGPASADALGVASPCLKSLVCQDSTLHSGHVCVVLLR